MLLLFDTYGQRSSDVLHGHQDYNENICFTLNQCDMAF